MAHTLRLTKLFPVIYSALTFKKKILTRRTHTPSSSFNYPFTGLSYCLYNPFIGQKHLAFPKRGEHFQSTAGISQAR